MPRLALVQAQQLLVALAHDGDARAGGCVLMHETTPALQKHFVSERIKVNLPR